VPTRSRRRLQVLALLLVALPACGPFGYLQKVAKDASQSVADAEAVGAAQYAPYEYWGAVSYLEQAKILMAYSEYERSFDYGVRAKQLAEEAKTKAERREAGKMTETLEQPPTLPKPQDPAGPNQDDNRVEDPPIGDDDAVEEDNVLGNEPETTDTVGGGR
jgi:hypothetical protein